MWSERQKCCTIHRQKILSKNIARNILLDVVQLLHRAELISKKNNYITIRIHPGLWINYQLDEYNIFQQVLCL